MSDRPSVLVVGAAELAACGEVLGHIGSDFVQIERSSELDPSVWPRDLLVTSARAALELARSGAPEAEPPPAWVCVHDEEFDTRRPELVEAGVDYLVRAERGVEPDRELLRLLFLQVLYEGAERRGEVRLPCSHSVDYVAAGARVRGRLMDLSRAGFRVLGPRALAPESPLELHLPDALDPSPPIGHAARVRRCAPALRGPDGHERVSIVARFAGGAEQAARIAAVLESCVRSGTSALVSTGARRDPDRRFAARHRYAGVAAIRCLDADEYCIVQGSDLSLSGMRLAFHPSLDVGSELSVDIHTGRDRVVVTVRGRVRRHDASGLGVEFGTISPADGRVLREVIDELPRGGAVCTSDGPDAPRPLLLCSVRV
jgi:hypothetical protein